MDLFLTYGNTLIALSIAGYAYLRQRHNPNIWLKGIYVLGAMQIVWGVLLCVLQYQAWHESPGLAFLLPPYQGIGYFITFVSLRYLLPVGIAIVCGTALLRVLRRPSWERFLYQDEPYIVASACIAVGYPGIMIYLPACIIFFLVYSLGSTLMKGKDARVSMRYLWIPLAVCVMILNNMYLQGTDTWNFFVI